MEEEKRKKYIGSNYGILIILLFVIVCFLTDYTIIDKKTRACKCSKCEFTSNEVISDNTDNTQVTEKQYGYKDVAGHYTARFDFLDDGYGNEVSSIYHLYLYNDATFYYTRSLHYITGKIGTYTISKNNISLNVLFSHGSDIGMGVFFDTINMSFNDNYEISVDSPDGIENQGIVLSRVEKYESNDSLDSNVKHRLDNSILYNNYTREN